MWAASSIGISTFMLAISLFNWPPLPIAPPRINSRSVLVWAFAPFGRGLIEIGLNVLGSRTDLIYLRQHDFNTNGPRHSVYPFNLAEWSPIVTILIHLERKSRPHDCISIAKLHARQVQPLNFSNLNAHENGLNTVLADTFKYHISGLTTNCRLNTR